MSVAELDRYRWKVTEAVNAYNLIATNFTNNLSEKRNQHATCDAYWEAAMAIEQVLRRTEILKRAVMGLTAALGRTAEWISEIEVGSRGAVGGSPNSSSGSVSPQSILGKKNEIRELLMQQIQQDNSDAGAYARQAVPCFNPNSSQALDAAKIEYISEFHGKCGNWCAFRDQTAMDNWAVCKERAAAILRTLASPFGPDDFNNNLGSLW